MDAVLIPVWPDAGKSLGVGRTTVWSLVRSGQLPSVRIGRRRLVPVTAIAEYAKRLQAEQKA